MKPGKAFASQLTEKGKTFKDVQQESKNRKEALGPVEWSVVYLEKVERKGMVSVYNAQDADVSAATMHTALTLPWEVARVSVGRGEDIIWKRIQADCCPPVNLAIST